MNPPTTVVPPRTMPPRQLPPRNGSFLPADPVKSYQLKTSEGAHKIGQRIGIYGAGGVGKTTLTSMLAEYGRTVSFDLDDSLRILGIGNIQTVDGIHTWADLRGALAAPIWDGVQNIIIDSLTRAEEMAVAHTLETIPHEKGHKVKRLEDYGYGKGYQYVYDTMLPLFSDLETHMRAGRNVVIVMHDCVVNVPNPSGEDWIRYEPRLQSPNSGKASIRLRTREWLDHLLFIGYDVATKDGKGIGSGTRTIWPSEMPHCMAKNRNLMDEPMEFIKNDATLWNLIFKTEGNANGNA